MNMHTFRLKEIDRSETVNWTPVEAPITKATEEAATPVSKGNAGLYLVRLAHRASTRGTSTLMFLVLGATGLWVVVDLVKLVVSSFKDE
jgi:hypothetical protein